MKTLPVENPSQDAPSTGVEINPPEVEIVTTSRVACDGGPGLGHPRVWHSIDPVLGFVECGYCDKRFILKGGPADTEALK